MSLDNIQFPGFILQDLFQKTLVDLSGSEKIDLPLKNNEINFFGGNKQHIILLVNIPEVTFVSDEQLTFLSGILTACKLTLEDVGLVNIASYPELPYKKISEAFTPRITIMFGVEPATIQLPFVMPAFQRQSFNNQVYLAVPTLTELENNKDLKRRLWAVLQQIFLL